MKKLFTKIILVCLAFAVFTTGLGVTLINFCCNNCLESFYSTNITSPQHCNEAKETNSCCSHEKESQDISMMCDESHAHEGGCCKFKRYSFDLDSFHSKAQLQAFFHWVDTGLIYTECIDFEEPYIPTTVRQLKIPSTVPPRTYLSVIRVLII